ncbi:SseB family protein [Pseudogemmobacter sonorensis]|uniref:SseB family protein n=1 Tax=Pseudogemmobacter sonorensis TaxID=2989681 RepID=UPI0036CFCEDD
MISDTPTLLDAAHAAVSADPENEAARLRFYERLADGELLLLLSREARSGDEAGILDPRIFDLEEGPVVLVFDREDRLADFAGGVVPYAALPGRVVAGLLRGQGIGLGVNLGVAPSSMLLPPEAMDWLAETLDGGPEEAEAVPESFVAPSAPEALVAALDAKLAKAGGLAEAALLVGVRYRGGRAGHMLAFLGAAEGAEPALARAAREALVFSGIEAGEMDVVFLNPGEGVLPALARVALRFDLPLPEAPPRAASGAPAPAAPGMDPARPPKLR